LFGAIRESCPHNLYYTLRVQRGCPPCFTAVPLAPAPRHPLLTPSAPASARPRGPTYSGTPRYHAPTRDFPRASRCRPCLPPSSAPPSPAPPLTMQICVPPLPRSDALPSPIPPRPWRCNRYPNDAPRPPPMLPPSIPPYRATPFDDATCLARLLRRSDHPRLLLLPFPHSSHSGTSWGTTPAQLAPASPPPPPPHASTASLHRRRHRPTRSCEIQIWHGGTTQSGNAPQPPLRPHVPYPTTMELFPIKPMAGALVEVGSRSVTGAGRSVHDVTALWATSMVPSISNPTSSPSPISMWGETVDEKIKKLD
jgi:hypothetical protein